ncbi:MAG: DUF3887 domain-containing protein [Peptostreptococcaceae bacterium]
MKKMKLLLMMVLGCVMLVGCSSSKLSESFDEQKLKTTTEEVIQMLLNGEYDKIEAMSNKVLIDAKVTEQLSEVWEPLAKDLGKFESYEKEAVVGKDNDATVIIITKFENGKAQFTISYNEDMELIGFFIK